MAQPANGGVMVAIPNMGWIRTGLFPVLMHWLRSYDATLHMPIGLQPMAFARNECVKHFLRTQCDILLFIDDDVLPRPDALKLLLDSNKRVITGVYPMLQIDDDGQMKAPWIVARRNDAGELKVLDGEGIERIHASGFGLIMLERSVFDEVPYPWFEDRSVPGVRGDFLFCKKLEDGGIEMFAHFGVQASHLKEVDL